MDPRRALQLLGLCEPPAGPPELRRAWRRYAMRHHPDRCPGDAGAVERFTAGRAAYEALAALTRTPPARTGERPVPPFRPWPYRRRRTEWVA